MIYIYTRVSTLAQVKTNDSLDIQVAKCSAWASYKFPDVETKIIKEEAISGSMPMKERPEGSVVFNAAKSGDIFISYKLDRAFRNTQDALLVAEDFKKRGIGLVLLNMSENDITTDSIGKLIFTILAAVAEMERETIRDRMKEGKASRKSKGGYVGGVVPFGYRSIKDPNQEKGKIKVEDEYEQDIIDQLTYWISKGNTYESWSKVMQAKGINKNASAWCKIYKREAK